MDAKQHDVAQAATAILAKSSIRELRDLRVDESNNQLELTGEVRSFYHKQLAQEAVRPVAEGMQLVNHVQVCA